MIGVTQTFNMFTMLERPGLYVAAKDYCVDKVKTDSKLMGEPTRKQIKDCLKVVQDDLTLVRPTYEDYCKQPSFMSILGLVQITNAKGEVVTWTECDLNAVGDGGVTKPL